MEISEKYWQHLQKNAKKRGISFLLNKKEALEIFLNQERKCAITKIQLYLNLNASLDRINSNQPYVWHNVQWVLSDINIMKKDHNIEYFKHLCRLVCEANI